MFSDTDSNTGTNTNTNTNTITDSTFDIINPNTSIDNITPDNITTDDCPQTNLPNVHVGTNPDVVYLTFLDEIYETINENKNVFSNSTIQITKPDIIFENKRTCWTNFQKNCDQISRNVLHVQKFIESELSVETSIGERGNLIMKGRYDFNNVSKQFKLYIKTFVQCQTCKSFSTEICRNTVNRMDYLKCLNTKPLCGTQRVVPKL